MSLGVHAILAGGVLIANVWDVTFPKQSPKMFAQYSLVEPPPPPPPPPPPTAQPRPQVARQVPVKMPLVAPTIIPDLIPVVDNTPPPPEPPTLVATTETAPPAGADGGEAGGEIGGVTGGIVLKPQPLPDLVKIERDLPLPMGSVSQEYPMYPEYARTRGWEDTLVVRYIIGKNGKVREVTVIQPPQREEFARAAVDAIKYWRFHPLRDTDGTAKEVVHELTVEFKVKRTAVR